MIERTLFTPDHESFRDSFRKFIEKEIAPFHAEWEEQGYVAREVWNKAGENGFLCMSMPEQYGGSDADKLFSVIQFEELARAGTSGIGYSLHSEIVAPYILHYGTEEQKAKYLPKLATGEMIGAIAMSEPAAGSDLQGIKTTAIQQADGSYLLNGSKTFITNGWHADLVIVVAKTNPQAGGKGTSLMLIERGMPGFSVGKRLKKLGMKAQDTSELFFDNVRIPAGNMLGKEGKGFAQMMTKLSQERLAQAIRSATVVETVIDWTLQYTAERSAFGQKLADFQNTQFKLAALKTKATVARVFTDKCISLFMEGKLDPVDAAMAKMFTSELHCEAVDECLQLFGGWGYMWEYPIARAYADARIVKIAGGSIEIMKTIIARQMYSQHGFALHKDKVAS